MNSSFAEQFAAAVKSSEELLTLKRIADSQRKPKKAHHHKSSKKAARKDTPIILDGLRVEEVEHTYDVDTLVQVDRKSGKYLRSIPFVDHFVPSDTDKVYYLFAKALPHVHRLEIALS